MPTKNRLLTMFVLFLFGNSAVIAEQTGGSVSLSKPQAKALEATAATPEQHDRLAAYYREEARKFDEKVRYHEEMREMYRKNPLPFDGKMAVSMERHCKEWAWRFGGQAERATVLAAFHEQKALGVVTKAAEVSPAGSWGLRTTGFTPQGSMIGATQEQHSMFRDSVAASARLYDLARILTYVVSANHQPPVETAELRKSAAHLFVVQEHFVGSLTEPQKTTVGAHLLAVRKLRQNMEAALNQLDTMTPTPANKSYFNAATKIKRSLESWNTEQQAIAIGLRIEN